MLMETGKLLSFSIQSLIAALEQNAQGYFTRVVYGGYK